MKNREKYREEIIKAIKSREMCEFMNDTVIPEFIGSKTDSKCICEMGDCRACLIRFTLWLDEEYIEIKEIPEYCEACRYFGSRPHPRGGWMDLCELCGERIDADGCKDDGWCYDGNKRPDNCPLMEVTDDK